MATPGASSPYYDPKLIEDLLGTISDPSIAAGVQASLDSLNKAFAINNRNKEDALGILGGGLDSINNIFGSLMNKAGNYQSQTGNLPGFYQPIMNNLQGLQANNAMQLDSLFNNLQSNLQFNPFSDELKGQLMGQGMDLITGQTQQNLDSIKSQFANRGLYNSQSALNAEQLAAMASIGNRNQLSTGLNQAQVDTNTQANQGIANILGTLGLGIAGQKGTDANNVLTGLNSYMSNLLGSVGLDQNQFNIESALGTNYANALGGMLGGMAGVTVGNPIEPIDFGPIVSASLGEANQEQALGLTQEMIDAMNASLKNPFNFISDLFAGLFPDATRLSGIPGIIGGYF